MKYQQKQSKQTTYDRTSKRKSKNIDIFQTAPITPNIFQHKTQLQFTYQIKPLPKPLSSPQKPITSPKKPHHQQIHPIQISLKPQSQLPINQLHTPQKQSQQILEQQQQHLQNNKTHQQFIFQNQSSSDQQKQTNKQILNNNLSSNTSSNILPINNNQSIANNQFIFVNDSSSQQHESSSTHTPNKKNNNKIQIINNVETVRETIQLDQQIKQSPQLTENTKEQQIQPATDKPKQFLTATTSLSVNTFAKLKLIRDKKSPGGTQFSLFLQANSRYILSAKNTSSQTYILSQNPSSTFQQNSKGYIGKIKTSFFSNQVNLYTPGCNPQKQKQSKKPKRQLICTIITHDQLFMQQTKPRDFTVYILKQGLSYYTDLIGFKTGEQQISLQKLYQQYFINRQKIYKFQNRKSKWNQQQQMHSLNMKSRAKVPSIKNFILENPSENGRQIMLFGKMDQNQFSFDIHHPLTPTIGMAVAISSFVQKFW